MQQVYGRDSTSRICGTGNRRLGELFGGDSHSDIAQGGVAVHVNDVFTAIFRNRGYIVAQVAVVRTAGEFYMGVVSDEHVNVA